MAFRTLYLKRYSTPTGRGSLAGRLLYDRLQAVSAECLLGHVVLAEDAGATLVVPQLQDDIIPHALFEKLSPNLIFLEGGLFGGIDGSWRAPRSTLERAVQQGAVLIVADVDHTDAMAHKEEYRKAAGFLGASIDYGPGDRSAVYGLDEERHDGGFQEIVCSPSRMVVSDWLRPALDGVPNLLAIHAVRLRGWRDVAASCNRDTTGTLQDDLWIDPIDPCPFTSVTQVGRGYVVLIAAKVTPDGATSRHPGNIDWILQLAALLIEEAQKDAARAASHLRSSTSVFLSHRTLDKPRVDPIARGVQRRGIGIWYDRHEILPSDSLVERIERGLDGMTHFVLFWSAACVDAPWVRRELNVAVTLLTQRRVPIFVVRLDTTPPPVILTDLAWIDAQHQGAEETASALASAIERVDVRRRRSQAG